MGSTRLKRIAVILVLTVCVTALILSGNRWRGASPLRRADTGHDGQGIAVLEDKTLVAAGKNQITGWDLTAQRRWFTVDLEVPVASIAAGQGGRFYVLDEEGGLLCFDDLGQTVAARPKAAGPIQCMAFRNGRLAAVSEKTLFWLDPITLRRLDETRELSGPGSVIDHQGDTVCVGNFLADKLRIFEADDEWTIPLERVGAVRISNDGKWIGVVTWRGELVLIDRVQQAIAWRNELAWTGEMRSVDFSPDCKHVVTCSPVRGRVWVLDCESGQSVLESSVGGDPLVVKFTTSNEVLALHLDGDLRWWSLK
jgi:hypothetical protein